MRSGARVHVALLCGGAAVNGENLFVQNILEAAAGIGSKGGHLGGAAEDEVPKCGEELIEDGRRLLAVKWRFAQVIVPSSVVYTQLPPLYVSCTSNNL